MGKHAAVRAISDEKVRDSTEEWMKAKKMLVDKLQKKKRLYANDLLEFKKKKQDIFTGQSRNMPWAIVTTSRNRTDY